jgi:hypothetical protein
MCHMRRIHASSTRQLAGLLVVEIFTTSGLACGVGS